MHAIYLADGMLVHQYVASDGEERHGLRMFSWIPARVMRKEPEMLHSSLDASLSMAW